MATEVSEGIMAALSGWVSQPVTLRSSGTRQPRSVAPRTAPAHRGGMAALAGDVQQVAVALGGKVGDELGHQRGLGEGADAAHLFVVDRSGDHRHGIRASAVRLGQVRERQHRFVESGVGDPGSGKRLTMLLERFKIACTQLAVAVAAHDDPALAERTWAAFSIGLGDQLNINALVGEDRWETIRVEGATVLEPVDGAASISDDGAPPYGPAALQILALIGDRLPAEPSVAPGRPTPPAVQEPR